ncbi:MAG: NADH-quinone oxidoreductase subunit L [Deltaproteobacteria bacterium]|nr:NADH-quinone oxidoreductase subunit L [Deltaproteobacteria bacterium]
MEVMERIVLNPYVAWIAAFPLLGAILNGFLLSWIGKLLPRRTRENLLSRSTVHMVALMSVGASFVVAALAAIYLWKGWGEVPPPQAIVARLWNWLPLADLSRGVPSIHDTVKAAEVYVPVNLMVDRLSAMMAVMVSGVSFLIHVYSMGYMGHDKSYRRFFTYLNLFVFFMLVLVLADNLVLMFVGWEGVGLCSYLLIGFWFDKEANAQAGKKAFIVNRIGDFGFLLGIFFLASWLGTVRFQGMTLPNGTTLDGINTILAGGGAGLLPAKTVLGVSGAFLVSMLLFVGATGKSAQIPLYVWLPDAMAGPTPVSALIHAATMVTAGVYMIARLSPLFSLSPTAMAVVATVGAGTALFAATIGLTQFDIKKVLAYSTISQLGYMFLAVGVGAFSAGMFHLFTHAFFKACLFLCAGAVIHAMHERQDIREMGGLRKSLPVVHWTFLASTLAIAGFPPFAGFFSKDEILWTAFAGSAITRSAFVPSWWPTLLWAAGMAAAACTAFYMFRLYLLTFWGESRAPEEVREHLHPPERRGALSFLWTDPHTPGSMRVVLMVLGAFATVIGLVGMPALVLHGLEKVGLHVPNLFDRWLHPSVVAFTGHGSASLEGALMFASVLVAVAGAYLAWTFYRSWPPQPAQAVIAAVPRLYKLVLDKWRIDELYGWIIVRPVRLVAFACYEFVDRVLIDTILVTGTAYVARGVGGVFRKLQGGVIHRYAAVMALGVAGVLWFVAQPYATVPLLERPVRFLRYVGQDPGTGAARMVLVLPDAPYVYELDLDSDGTVDVDVDPRAPVYDRTVVRGDVFLVCLPEGQNVVTAVARSGFDLTRKLVLTVDIVGPLDCRPWTVREDPRFSRAAVVAEGGRP